MMLAGVPVPDRLALELARLLREAGLDGTAGALEEAYDREQAIVALTIVDREAILRVLDDAPEGLGELRGVLMREHVGRQEQGLV